MGRDNARKGNAPTLADIARVAGVSVSTAGRVMRQQDWPVDEELKKRVLQAAAELAYVPNVMARTLRAGAPALVGLVVGNMLDPYYGEIAEAVTKHGEATNKMLVMVCNMQRDPMLELDYCRRLWEHRVAGLILAGGGFDQFSHNGELLDLLDRMERSGVVITTLSPRDIPVPAFCIDNEEAGRIAATDLVGHGHRRIGILTGAIQNRVVEQRLSGIRSVFSKSGVDYRIADSGSGAEWAISSVGHLFDADPDITGIVAVSSATSANVLHAVEATGRTVPDDVSVVSIGGSMLGEWSTPKLTRVDIALDECGRGALDYIAARVNEDDAPVAGPYLPRLIRGGSVTSRH
ncbi:LacI family transcriptional regulator [Neorhizobium sp. P12A]|uniref:LacI family DNA-binding transcriptional regulator n=1 Tax=Rhizobium/Agrobacterium group TaxID=227290 RepID=UPI0010DF8394|nr:MULTISPECIES: LacI family DNA-binding transcriptional regulator [Rhizobium/Agrobacterium group]KAA0685350.1 LacI family transcriptional regulator [Neorhizobium sp. P12A]TCR71441.1 LacI family transcriptional regulator [Rhizobium sp. BK376]